VKTRLQWAPRGAALALGITFSAIFGMTFGTSPLRAAEAKVHHVAIQVDSKDPAVMNLALNNALNVARDFSARGQQVDIEIVAYGPGLHMLRDDTSPVKARLKSMSESMPNLAFEACANTRKAMKKAEGKDIPLVAQANVVPSGVVHLVELQEQGWSYIRP
jgi:intracellular sulfur oxidation DsrE/DsrF family protein